MHIKKGRKSVEEMRLALMKKALNDMMNQYADIVNTLPRDCIEDLKSRTDLNVRESHEAATREVQEIGQKTKDEMQRIHSMNNREITLLYNERFPE